MTKRQNRTGLARIAGAGKKKGRDLPHVPQRIIEKSGKVRKTEPKKKSS